ncbi:MAG: hypothetical protein RLY70_398 [Planctomycetota bacterium]
MNTRTMPTIPRSATQATNSLATNSFATTSFATTSLATTSLATVFATAAGVTLVVAIVLAPLNAAEPPAVAAVAAAAKDEAAAQIERLARPFAEQVKPFLDRHCLRCHQADKATSGVRVDQLGPTLDDRHMRLWESIRKQVLAEAMPPEDEPQPSADERRRVADWIEQAVNAARSRPLPKNGGVRRLTAAQYRNTLRELLLIDDNLTDILPPDAISREGFLNNRETLALSPLLLEAYFQIAQQAIERAMVDPARKPVVQNFRMNLGTAINPAPCPDRLILGANSLLLRNEDFQVEELSPEKPFAYEPFRMRTKYRFIEGYVGNDTIRAWRDFDSIYHSVFACLRGSPGYPKGQAYSTVPEGLLLRPAITNEEQFDGEGTYGPKANFKISLRELPDEGRFRVTVTAAKYDDGLLVTAADVAHRNAAAQSDSPSSATDASSKANTPASTAANANREWVAVDHLAEPRTAAIPTAGIYLVQVHSQSYSTQLAAPDSRRLADSLVGTWSLNGSTIGTVNGKSTDGDDSPTNPAAPDPLTGRLAGDARFVRTPFGQGLKLDGDGDSLVVPRTSTMAVGTGDFTVAAWIHPRQLRQGGIVCLGKYAWTQGWYLDMPDGRGVLRIETVGPQGQPNGTVASPPGKLRVNAWQHVAAVVRRKPGETRLFINGYPVARGAVGPLDLDNPKVDLHFGRIQDAQAFAGELDEVRIYRRALEDGEIQALVEPGRKFAVPPRDEPKELELTLGNRRFSGALVDPSFVVVRLPAGPLAVAAKQSGSEPPGRVTFERLPESDPLAERFATFERRVPRVGVHLGLRRDCGSTLTPVGDPQPVTATTPQRFVFEGAIRNFASPDVEKDNVNYLAGVREIGVRSEFTDGRDMPRLLVRSVEFEGPLYDTWPPASHRNILSAAEDGPGDRESREAALRVVRRFASRAFRRPVSDAEAAALMAVFDRSRADGAPFLRAVQDALLVTLTSPQFLFLVENSTTPAAEPLDEHELASKLSYFLWNGPPDPRLLELAARGQLRSELAAETTRMIADPRFSRAMDEFASQWLGLEKFAVLEPDRGRFPRMRRDTRTQLRQEPVRFVEHLIRENLPASNLIESDFIVANEVVANFYDLGDKTDSGFRFVPIGHSRPELGGVLSQAAIMAGLSDGREPNAIKRGAWLARKIVAEPPDDPPPNVPALKEETKNAPLRLRLEQHRSQPGCAQCHSKIDPWGIPLEEIDAGGRLRPPPVDARSKLPDGTEVASFGELRRYLAGQRLDQVAFSVLVHLTTYANGRSLSYHEMEFLKRDAVKLRTDGYRMRDMVQYVVASPMFLEK